MPGFTGRVLAERLTADRPETKCLYVRVRDDETAKYGILRRRQRVLEKPFTRDDLVPSTGAFRSTTTGETRSAHLEGLRMQQIDKAPPVSPVPPRRSCSLVYLPIDLLIRAHQTECAAIAASRRLWDNLL